LDERKISFRGAKRPVFVVQGCIGDDEIQARQRAGIKGYLLVDAIRTWENEKLEKMRGKRWT
jgi:hypothetical protein